MRSTYAIADHHGTPGALVNSATANAQTIRRILTYRQEMQCRHCRISDASQMFFILGSSDQKSHITRTFRCETFILSANTSISSYFATSYQSKRKFSKADIISHYTRFAYQFALPTSFLPSDILPHSSSFFSYQKSNVFLHQIPLAGDGDGGCICFTSVVLLCWTAIVQPMYRYESG